MLRSKKPGRFSSGRMRIVPRTALTSIARPRRMAASVPVYSAAWIPAVMSTVGPEVAPAIAMYGQRYFARPSSSANVNVPLARSPGFGDGMGPMDTRVPYPALTGTARACISEDAKDSPRDEAQRRPGALGRAARLALECADRARRTEVVIERREHRARRSIAPERADRAAAKCRAKRSRALARPLKAHLVVIERAAVVDVEQVQTQRLRRGRLERGAHEDHVAERLGHLLRAEPHRRHVHPVAHERDAMRGLALRGLAFVMRVDEIASAAVDIDRQSEIAFGHRRTLEVPAGTSASELARPRRPAVQGAPQREVERVAALWRVERGIILRRVDRAHLRRREMADLAEARERRDVEVQPAALRAVGLPACLEALREPQHRRDLTRRVRHDVGPPPAQRAHVGEELALLALSERAPVDAVARRALQDRFVDVGDVLGVLDPLSTRFEQPRDEVEDQERTCVTEVCRVVWGHTTHVHRHLGRTGLERHDPAATRVVEGQHLA